jgi:hypothetical protein
VSPWRMLSHSCAIRERVLNCSINFRTITMSLLYRQLPQNGNCATSTITVNF